SENSPEEKSIPQRGAEIIRNEAIRRSNQSKAKPRPLIDFESRAPQGGNHFADGTVGRSQETGEISARYVNLRGSQGPEQSCIEAAHERSSREKSIAR